MTNKWDRRFELIRGFGWMALAGFVLLLAAIFTPTDFRPAPLIFGARLLVPALIYLYLIVIWHWKDRYRGNHSDLWGALILIETTGWSKLVYVFRHIVPDMRNKGRYRRFL
jgi:hypothetical protein